jgi:tRNA(Ile2) C34 agmatinyltransferase TiaS
MSLGTLAEYAARMAAGYGAPTPVTVLCPKCGNSCEAWPPEDGETRQIRCPSCGTTTTLALDAPAEPDAEPGPFPQPSDP